MSAETDRDLQLLSLVKQGDPMAMRKIYSTYIRYLTAVCARYIVNNEDVKDVLQNSFLKVFSEIASFEYRGSGSLKAWITRITVNEALKFLQRSNRIQFVEISDTELDVAEAEPDIDGLPTELLLNIIRQLPDGYRTVFNLYVIENKSHREISELLGIKESTSASQLHRAKSLIAAKIGQYTN